MVDDINIPDRIVPLGILLINFSLNLIVAVFHYFAFESSRRKQEDEEATLKKIAHQKDTEALQLMTPETFAKAAKLRRDVKKIHTSISKLQDRRIEEEKKMNIMNFLLVFIKIVIYLFVELWFEPRILVSPTLVTPFESVLKIPYMLQWKASSSKGSISGLAYYLLCDTAMRHLISAAFPKHEMKVV